MKFFIAIAAMLLTILTANAQSYSCQDVKTFSFKPYVGLSVGTLGTTAKQTHRIGINAGVEAQYQFTKIFALSVGAAYSQQGGKMEDLNFELCERVTYDNKLDFINVPVLANFYICKGLALKIGAQPGFLISSDVEVTVNATGKDVPGNYQDHLNKFVLSMPIGMSYEFNNIVFDARLNLNANGMFERCDDMDLPVAGNAVYQLTVGYRF